MKNIIRTVTAVTILVFLPVAAAKSSQPLDGIWQTEGYGYLFDIKADKVTIFEQTNISCLVSGLSSGKLSYQPKGLKLASFPVAIPGFIDADMEIHQGANSNQKLFHRSDTNSYIKASKIAALPKQCAKEYSNEEIIRQSYLVFKQNFAQHYPFFKQKEISWDHLANSTATSDSELFAELTQLVSPLKDAHIAIVAPAIDGYYFGNEEVTAQATPLPKASLLERLRVFEPQIKLQSYANEQLQFSKLGKYTGYLAINSFTGFSKQGDFNSELETLNKVLTNLLSEHSYKTLILDVRNNIGGSDKLAIAMAAKFTSSRYSAYAKQALKTAQASLNWTEANTSWVNPSSEQLFVGEILLLTNRQTVSAGETFTMALMERSPKVTRIGDYTKGSFSDMLPRTLPNGWLFALPNERYLDKAGKSYDISGIPPQIKVADTEEIDQSLAKAMELAGS